MCLFDFTVTKTLHDFFVFKAQAPIRKVASNHHRSKEAVIQSGDTFLKNDDEL